MINSIKIGIKFGLIIPRRLLRMHDRLKICLGCYFLTTVYGAFSSRLSARSSTPKPKRSSWRSCRTSFQ